jgi:NADH-quinone oxidoreductase subunit B
VTQNTSPGQPAERAVAAAASDVPAPPVPVGRPEAAGTPVVLEVGGRRLRLHLVEAGLACCAVEQQAATALLSSLPSPLDGSVPDGRDRESGPELLDVLVVSGTVTDVMAPLLMRLHERLPEPKGVLSFGACSATGGPYWDSPVVTNGIDQLLPVDVYVPGCPPRPEAFVRGLTELVERMVGAPA